MEIYEVANKIKIRLETDITKFIDSYINKHSRDMGYLKFYPLFLIEELYRKNSSSPIKALDNMYELSWFVSNINNRYKCSNQDFFRFNLNNYNDFKNNYFNKIQDYYWNYKEIVPKLGDMYSPVGLEIINSTDKQYRVTWPLIHSPIKSEKIYFYSAADENALKIETELRERPLEYILNKLVSGKLSYNDFDEELYRLCINCVEIDTNKLGERIKSAFIKSKEDLNKFLGYFYYKSLLKSFFALSVDTYYIKIPQDKLIIELIDKIGLSEGKIKNLISYFTFNGAGSFIEFPLTEFKGDIYWCPFAWVLNDFQFSIVNGHYFKNTEFVNRDKTISHSIVATIEQKFNAYKNLKVKTEFYYEYYQAGKKINSDLDVVILDELNKVLLVIECKWKDNFYAIAGQEIITKVYRGVQKIYSDQIEKHKGFFKNDYEAIKKIFPELNINTEEFDIHYIVVDKRSQIFIDDLKLVPIFGLLYLAKIYSSEQILNLTDLINEINSYNTSVDYSFNELKKYVINEQLILLTEDINL